MAIQTVLQELEAVKAAINAILAGAQSYTIPSGVTFTRASLAALQRQLAQGLQFGIDG